MPAPTLFQTSPQEEQPSSPDWSFEFQDDLTGGVNTTARAKSLQPNQLIKANNIRFAEERVLSDLGYGTFGQVVLGTPRADYQFYKQSGSSFLVLVTNTRFYVWNSTVSEWEYVSNGTDTTLTADANATDTSLTVADITGFGDGDPIGIRLDNGKQHRTTVNGAPSGSTIPITDAMPSLASSGKAVIEGELLTGVDDIQPSFTTWAGTDAMYFANGADPVKKFDGTNTSDVTGLPAGTIARLITVHVNHLIIFNTEEGGTAFPQRERWSEPGVDTNWNTSVNYVDHYESEDHILAVDRLSVYLIIYKERSLIRQEYIGAADQNWHWVTTITGEGTVGADAVVNLGDSHIFWGNTNIYRYRGGFDIDPIGDPIFEGVFSAAGGDLNPANRERVFGLYVEELDDLLFFYPHGANEYPRRAARLNVGRESWSFRDFTFNVTGFGFYSRSETVKWNTAVGTWAEQVGPWIGSALQAEAPTLHLCDGSNLRIYDYDFITTKDNTVDIPYEVITKDWYVPNRELRFDRYDFTMKGTSILVEVSYDEGVSFETLGTVTPGTMFKRQRFYRQKVARSVRFRFTGQKDFGISDLGFKYKRESIPP